MRIRWSDEARAELLSIVQTIARTQPAAARKIRDHLRDAGHGLRAHPQLGRVVPELENPMIRERVVQSYRIMYLVRNQEILIVTIVHGRQVAGAGGTD